MSGLVLAPRFAPVDVPMSCSGPKRVVGSSQPRAR